MKITIALWIGGTLFTLGVFAVKAGLGLAYGRVGAKGTALALAAYITLFIAMALLAEKLSGLLLPLLAKGPYLHIAMAAGMIAWGLFAIARPAGSHQACGKDGDVAVPALLLILPCPVCLAAMTFSTASALAVIKLPPALIGTGIGAAFASLAIFVRLIAGAGRSEKTGASLGLVMIAIGVYFLASLFLPAKIEQAVSIYSSFTGGGGGADINSSAGVLLILLASVGIGYFRKHKEHKS